jgi:solute carrier family 26 (sodium-independent sulfate anion transporter), member 11
LDFSAVNNIDVTSVQTLIDVRNQLDRYASPDVVEWHIAHINNRWTKRALAAAGFGYPTPHNVSGEAKPWKPIFDVAAIGGSSSAQANEYANVNEKEIKRQQSIIQGTDATKGESEIRAASPGGSSDSDGDLKKELSKHAAGKFRVAHVQGINRPYFHIDITSALQSALSSIEHQKSVTDRGGPDTGVAP